MTTAHLLTHGDGQIHPTTQLDKTILDWIVKVQLGHHRPKSRKYPAEDRVSSRSDSSGYMERDCLGRKCPNWSWYRKSVNSLPPDAMENVPAEDGMSSRSDSGVAWKWMTVMESSTCVFKSLRFNYITPFRPARS